MTHRFQTFAVGDSVREKNTEEVGVIWKSEINVEQGTVDYYMTNDSGDAYSPLTYQELELIEAATEESVSDLATARENDEFDAEDEDEDAADDENENEDEDEDDGEDSDD